MRRDARSSTSATRCPAILVLTRDQGESTIRRFPRAEHSALSDPRTACTARSTGVDTDGTRFALMGEGRACFRGTAYSVIEEIYVLRRGQPVLAKKQQRGLLTESGRQTRSAIYHTMPAHVSWSPSTAQAADPRSCEFTLSTRESAGQRDIGSPPERRPLPKLATLNEDKKNTRKNRKGSQIGDVATSLLRLPICSNSAGARIGSRKT